MKSRGHPRDTIQDEGRCEGPDRRSSYLVDSEARRDLRRLKKVAFYVKHRGLEMGKFLIPLWCS